MRKFMIGLFATIFVVVVAVIAYVYVFGVDHLRQAIESYGGHATKADVRLSGVDLDLIGGQVVLHDFTQGNPHGYDSRYAVNFGTVTVNVDPHTFDRDVIVIRRVLIEGPQINYELGANGSNLQTIQLNVNDYIGSSAAPGPTAPGGGKKRLIEKVVTVLSQQARRVAGGMDLSGLMAGAAPDVQRSIQSLTGRGTMPNAGDLKSRTEDGVKSLIGR